MLHKSKKMKRTPGNSSRFVVFFVNEARFYRMSVTAVSGCFEIIKVRRIKENYPENFL